MIKTMEVKKIDLEQGSQEWLDLRRTKITATDCSCIAGVNPWKTRHMLWQEKLGLIQPTQMNYSMRRGQELEPIARVKVSELLGIHFQPMVLQHPEHEWMIASYDGVSPDMSCIVEIKCGKSAFKAAQLGEIPTYYIFQLQHQIEVCKPSKAFYYAYDGDTDIGILLDVDMRQEYIDTILEQEYAFYKMMINFEEPEIE